MVGVKRPELYDIVVVVIIQVSLSCLSLVAEVQR